MKQPIFKPLLFCFFWSFCSLLSLSAQTVTVTGTLKDKKGTPIPQALIEQKDGKAFARTDEEGRFSIAIRPGDVIIVRHGKLVKKVTVKKPVLELTMRRLYTHTPVVSDEMVETGYGMQAQRTLTTAVTSLKTEDFNYGNIYDPYQLIQGRVPGLLLSKPGDDPSGSFTTHQRGLHTILGDAQPLLVVDGFPGASLTTVDPQDIASVTVLRDAASASVYGTRAANGVLLITTKTAADTTGKLRIGLGTSVGIQQVADFHDVLSGDEYAALRQRTDIVNPGLINDLGSRTDWQNLITRKGLVHHHNLWSAWSKGGTTVRASFNLRGVEDIAPSAGFSQIGGSLNIGQRLFKNRLQLKFNGGIVSRNFSQALREMFYQAVRYNPTAPVYSDMLPGSELGGYFQEFAFENYNPVALLEQTEHGGNLQTWTANLAANWEIWKDFRVEGRLAWQHDQKTEASYVAPESYYLLYYHGFTNYKKRSGVSRLGEIGISQKLTAGKHAFFLRAGHSYQFIARRRDNFSLRNYVTDDFDFRTVSRDDGEWTDSVEMRAERGLDIRLSAFRGQLDYQFSNWLFLSGSARYEGCSRFGDNREWGWFYGISSGVDVAPLIRIKPIDQLKLRFSYGVTGNLPSDDVLSNLVFLETDDYINGIPVVYAWTGANPHLQWESRTDRNYGLDFSLWGGRLRGSYDAYHSVSDHVLYYFLPDNLTQRGTVADDTRLATKGKEFSLFLKIVEQKDWRWQVDFNIGSYRTRHSNERMELGGTIGPFGLTGNSGFINLSNGGLVGEIFGRDFLRAQNGFAVLSDTDVPLGNALPKNFWAIGSTLTWKGFDLGVRLRAVQGHHLLNELRFIMGWPAGAIRQNLLRSALESPYIDMPNGSLPLSDLVVHDASFIRVDNIRLGYRFDIRNNRYLSSLQVYLTGQNLITITKYKSPDPEVRLQDNNALYSDPALLLPGLDRKDTHFPIRTFLLGVNVEF